MPKKYIELTALKMTQPMGEFYVGVMEFSDLRDISFVDMRRIERDLDNYIGIQRKLSPQRVEEIGKFVNTVDAAFPTSIVLSVPEKCYEYNDKTHVLILRENLKEDDETDPVPFNEIAKILDGQHRIEGLKHYRGDSFQLPVTILVNADMADQAYIFATVNLAQTKVNRSLVYDLLDYSKSRSPQKTCHEVAVALNRHELSPFHGMIKRLGSATPGQVGETLTQATFVMSLLPFISNDYISDRDVLLRGRSLASPTDKELVDLPFRKLFIGKMDGEIAKNVSNYFMAISKKWPTDWKSRDRGNILPRTNGFRAFMRFLKIAYVALEKEKSKVLYTENQYAEILEGVSIKRGEFNTDQYPPGTSGEKKLFDQLCKETGIGVKK